jgi:hypothetical protein
MPPEVAVVEGNTYKSQGFAPGLRRELTKISPGTTVGAVVGTPSTAAQPARLAALTNFSALAPSVPGFKYIVLCSGLPYSHILQS